jgi:predicted nucleotidyltransferase
MTSKKEMPFGISDEVFSEIIQIFKEHEHIEKAILFGSRAKGTYKPGSDIDIALNGQELNLKDVLSMQNRLDDLDQPYFFDLVILNSITEDGLKQHIERVGVEIYSKAK